MSSRKQLTADLLFGVQVIGALVFTGAYIIRSLDDVTGTSLVQLGLVVTYLLFHLALGIGAHKTAPSRVTRQAIATYAMWIVLMGTLVAVVAANPGYRWNGKEFGQLFTAGILTVVVIMIAIFGERSVSDPMMKALFAIAYKSVPQALLAFKFLAEGASGTPGLSVFVGHFTILVRLGQIYFMVREAGWDRNRFWLAVSEGANELSWIAATLAWLIV